MKLLVLGGTRFVGKTMVETALARGHEVTLFNRGSNQELFPEVERLIGDRDGGLDALSGRQWDAVIDTCGYYPRVVEASVRTLADRVNFYTFISTLDVYEEEKMGSEAVDETLSVKTLPEDYVEDIARFYGAMKASCEQLVSAAFQDRSLIVRCGLVAGPGDMSDRFTYWPTRIARGGEVLAPGDPQAPIQFIDVRDLADWTIRMVERQAGGTFNATGPAAPLTVGELLERCIGATHSEARLTWVPDEFLTEHKIGHWVEMPLWLPASENVGGLMKLQVQKAVHAGLQHRPIEETIRDTWVWDRERVADGPRKAGLDPEKEAQLLEEWHMRHG
ncbi:NAD-dependent epimerase/dehydratase family protein [Paenibacillus sp. GCM10023248]|uniref:NAD-dependent epimerase/dehydratase family protein n=1 Tax=Bacillales TaxID=1385 RepID=UPI002377DA8B|nr:MULTISPECIES: NAD-dependent epimerase/dehydratase family protein [Bacillales]MDD9268152.1 NAD-dependent epimerase/dehydratase family protein [Paenibacillus sp. MAHUQ-63]MDR6879831.1 2'-hydroxyisoflavone reductase [Bacillus sp. 3255]